MTNVAKLSYDDADDIGDEEVYIFFSVDNKPLDVSEATPLVVDTITKSLESMVGVAGMKDSVLASEAMTQQEFFVVKQVLADQYVALGFPQQSVLATEEFNPRTAKELALEGIGDFLKACWDNIVKMIKWLGRCIKELFGYGEKEKIKNISNNIRDLDEELKRIIKDHRFDITKLDGLLLSDPDFQTAKDVMLPLCTGHNFGEIDRLMSMSLKDADSCTSVPVAIALDAQSLSGVVINALTNLDDKKEIAALLESPSILVTPLFNGYMTGYDAESKTAIQHKSALKSFSEISSEERSLLRNCDGYNKIRNDGHSDVWFTFLPIISKVFVAYKSTLHPALPDTEVGCALSFGLFDTDKPKTSTNKLYAASPTELSKTLTDCKALFDKYVADKTSNDDRAQFMATRLSTIVNDKLARAELDNRDGQSNDNSVLVNKLAISKFLSYVMAINATYLGLVTNETSPFIATYTVFEGYFKSCTKAYKDSEKSSIVKSN